jgi:hypothetical protein
MAGISGPAENRLASQEGLCYTELVIENAFSQSPNTKMIFLASGWRFNVSKRQPFLDACSHSPVSNQVFCRIGSRLTMTVTRNQRLLSRGDRTMVSEFLKQSNTRRHLYPTPFCSSLRHVLHAEFAKPQRRLVRLLYFLCRPSLGNSNKSTN